MTEESIHDIIAKSAHLGEEGALRSLLARPKIRTWVGNDPVRETRLKEEFHRLWIEHHGDPAAAPLGADGPKAGPAAPPTRRVTAKAVHAPPPVHEAEPEPEPEPARETRREAPATRRADVPVTHPVEKAVKGGRRESFMCTSCGSLSIYTEWTGDRMRVSCHACKTEYPDMLKLIPVKEVGVVELLFGPGWLGYVKLGAMLAGALGIWFLLKALR